MMKEFNFGGKKVRLIAYADRIIRVQAGETLAESLFDRYNLLRKPDENVGSDIENGVAVDGLSVTYADGIVTFKTDRVTRTVDLATPETDAIKEYFNTKLNGMRPSPKQIIGEDAKRSYGTQDLSPACRISEQ